MSLGLTLTSDLKAHKTLACGPTITRECRSINTYNGVCLEMDERNIKRSIPSSLEACPESADIAFLLDGSGSVSNTDFRTMKGFVKRLIDTLRVGGSQFAIAEYSTDPSIRYYFNNFNNSGSWEKKIDSIPKSGGSTYTAKSIEHVVDNIFSQSGGSRKKAKKVLIVITDGQSHDSDLLKNAAEKAEKKGIVRFAVGVGRAFTTRRAIKELDTIASQPTKKHRFQVNNFDVLEIIRGDLEAGIFPIEGSVTGSSLEMEMAQEGFSAAYVPGVIRSFSLNAHGGVRIASVGAFQWRGGFQEYPNAGREIFSEAGLDMDPDSYLGYSMAVAKTKDGSITIVGAPGYKLRGVAVVFPKRQKVEPWQIGEYFGAEVVAMTVVPNRENYTDVVLLAAPLHQEQEREGLVYVCTLTASSVNCQFDVPVVLRGQLAERGRFGSSMAPLPDLNQDGLNDLAVGAPMENDGQGSVYIFHGDGRGTINPTFSQRIAGSDIELELRFFGVSISPSSFDHSGDNLPDLSVGSKGAVVLLRSRPIVMVETQVIFTPAQIPSTKSDVSHPVKHAVSVCFTMTRVSPIQSAKARIKYTLSLDVTGTALNHRAFFQGNKRNLTGSSLFSLERECTHLDFFVVAFPDDLKELSNELRFTFEGIPSPANLRPILSQQAQTTSYYPLSFEVDCGEDNVCVDNLKVDFNFTSSSAVRVGIDDLLTVTVSVINRGEDSYNSHVVLSYPTGLSYRKFNVLEGRVECRSVDSENGLTLGRGNCLVYKPTFKTNTKAVFTVSYGIDTNSYLSRKILITANASSENTHANESELYRTDEIAVKYSVFVSIASSFIYTNFTSGNNDLQKPVQHSVTVLNRVRAFNVTVVIKIPVQLGDKDIWQESRSIQIPECQRDGLEEPADPDFLNKLKKNRTVDCSVARCSVFRCSLFMGREQSNTFLIKANISSRWIEQIGLQSAKFLLVSTATLEYDDDQYIFYSSESTNSPPVQRIVTEVEVYPEVNFTKEIVGGSVGGLILLALITVGLYKAGFFKSHFKQMIAEGGGDSAQVQEAPTSQ